MDLEKSKNASWLIDEIKMSFRHSIFFANVALCVFIFYFSVLEDGIAAFLSYVTAALSVLTMNVFRGAIYIDESFAYSVDLLSKILVFVGFILVLFPQFWNTSFYYVCLGIFIRMMKHEIESSQSHAAYHLNVQLSRSDSKTNAVDDIESRSLEKSINLQKTSEDEALLNERLQNKNKEEFYTLNKQNEDSLLSQNMAENIPVKQEKNTEIRSLDKKSSKLKLDGFQTGDKTISSQNFEEETLEPIQKNEDSSCTESSGRKDKSKRTNIRDLIEQQKLKRKLNLDDIRREIKENSKEVVENIQTLNEQERKLRQYGKTISRLHAKQENGATNYSKKLDLINKILYYKLPKDAKQVVAEYKRFKSVTEAENKIENGHSEQVNIDSHVYEKYSTDVTQKNIISCNSESYQQNNAFNHKIELQISNSFKDDPNLHDSEFKNLDGVQAQQKIDKGEQENESSLENSINDDDFQKTSEIDEITTESKYASTNWPIVEFTATEIRSEIFVNQMKYVEEQVKEANLKSVSEEYVKVIPESDFSKSRIALNHLNSSKIESDDHSLKMNESVNDAEEKETNESVTNVSKDVDASNLSSVSDEGVVNRIDPSFIYNLF